VIVAALVGSAYVAIDVFPSLGARAADYLREVVGDKAVAQLESAVYGAQDHINQKAYALGLKKAESPWVAAPVLKIHSPAAKSSSKTVAVAKPQLSDNASPSLRTDTTPVSPQPAVPSAQINGPMSDWLPTDVPAFGQATGEGKWQPYIQNADGQVVAYRTFLSPDPQRPYANIAIVAFNLSNTHLNFVLGSQEPKSPVKVDRTGKIPEADAQPGKLLAVFNGGWKAQHGHFGLGINGTTVLPPINGIATVAIQDDGSMHMGVWGEDVITDSHTLAWRQNNVPLIHNGQINPRTASMSIADWGSALDGNVAVWRSALGLSRDGKSLYFAAGDGVLVSAMATALNAVGAYQAMQLDVNNYWVHFDAVRDDSGALKAEPLFDAMGKKDNDRYLKGFTRDFFYVTAKTNTAS